VRERREKAHGPYQRGRTWRVVETSATGARSTCSFKTREEALDYIAEFNDEAEGRTVSGVIDAYRDSLRERGLRDGSITTSVFRLHGIMQDVERDRLLSSITPTVAGQLYAARAATVKADTHHAELAVASAMFTWCVRKGWLSANPFAAIEPVGRKTQRTARLRIDELRKLERAALGELTREGLAVAMAALMGLRATELTARVVRDVDDGGRLLWLDTAKTEASEGSVIVPPRLRARVAKLVAGRAPDERLFGDVDRHWLGYHVRRLCALAEVPIVSPHALRRTWASIGAESRSVDVLSRAMGHTSAAITRRHYIAGNAEQNRNTNVVLRAVQGGRR
jgi:integrase